MFHGDVISAWACRGQNPEMLEVLSARLNKTKEQNAWHNDDRIAVKSRHIPTHECVDEKTVYRFGGTYFVQGWMEGEMLMRPEDSASPAGFWFTDEARRSTLHIR
ncbi:hypothetical protein CCHR01_00817 [Colletotrichum chrysophilum]|uniref:Uncharacterized protein n=1 Tax=Colletotrichum chrysophilum TaxID=1836956 RepID=A0AAD9EQB1_9PEZI|nr:hypothetical protein CCHR01_00817 [Colletotrichum chrysophilum]